MKIYKKFLAAFICGAIMFLTACSNGSQNPDLSDWFTKTQEEDPYPLDTTVAFIYDGEVGANPFIAIFEQARLELERTLGVETCFMENVLLQQFAEAADIMVDNGATVIVAASVRYNSAVPIAAKKHLAREGHPIQFISFGGTDTAINLASFQPLLFQAANVVGFMSAYNTQTNKLGIIADNSLYNAHGIVNAFALGAKELNNSQIEVNVNWALSARHNDTRSATLDLIERGFDTIFVYQSGEIATRLCEEYGVKVVSFAYDLPEVAPENYLTGIYLNLNIYLIDNVRKAMYGNFYGELTRRGMSHGMVGLIKLNDNLARDHTREVADALIEVINDGRSTVFGGEIRDRGENIRVAKGDMLHDSQILTVRWLANTILVEQEFSVPITDEDLIKSDFTIKPVKIYD